MDSKERVHAEFVEALREKDKAIRIVLKDMAKSLDECEDVTTCFAGLSNIMGDIFSLMPSALHDAALGVLVETIRQRKDKGHWNS
jgi:hypothetical protein